MKDLTEEELLKAPHIIKIIYMSAISKVPIGSGTYERAIEDHPEYFPETIEHRRKWKLIPQEVHDEYWKEYWQIYKEIMKDVPPSKGIFGWIQNLDEWTEWNKLYQEAKEKGKHLHKNLHEKHYSKYGIEWQEW
jgi:hypothetical protein